MTQIDRSANQYKTVAARPRLDQPIGLDDPYSTDPTRVDAVRVVTDVGTGQASLHLQTTRQVSRWFDATAGVRVDRLAFIDAVTVTPRMSLMVHLRPALDLTGSYGRYTQMPALVFLTADSINRALLPVRAEHRVVGCPDGSTLPPALGHAGDLDGGGEPPGPEGCLPIRLESQDARSGVPLPDWSIHRRRFHVRVVTVTNARRPDVRDWALTRPRMTTGRSKMCLPRASLVMTGQYTFLV